MMTRTELLERAPRQILPKAGEWVLCAVSGGLDSMCLLHMLDTWCRDRNSRLAAAHFNHGLRGEAANRDAAFVREICGAWGIPLTVGQGDVREHAKREGQTVEEAARNLRYQFLRQAAGAAGCARIYTAHHANDNAETVLLNLIRGTGLRGLTGMDWERSGLCRPLLDVTRLELEDYAVRWNIPHVEDETNADPGAASRNLLRLQAMPLLKELNPRAVEHMVQTARQLQLIDSSLEGDAAARTAQAEVQKGRVVLSIDALYSAPEAVQPRMLLRLFDLLGVGRKDIGAVHVNALLNMCRRTGQGSESRVSLPRGVIARCCRRRLILEIRPQSLTEIQLIPDQPVRWGDYTLTLLDHPEGQGMALRGRTPCENRGVTVAPCPPGERLALPGTRGGRSVKRLCLDKHISLAERDRLPAVYVEGTLAAVWQLGVDTAFLPEGTPVRFIKIEENREGDRS